MAARHNRVADLHRLTLIRSKQDGNDHLWFQESMLLVATGQAATVMVGESLANADDEDGKKASCQTDNSEGLT